MRKLTLLSFAFGAAACGSEDRCDPFLEAMDCVHGQTPVGVHRYGTPQGEAPTVSPSSQIGPTAGSANGPGPSAGSANGPGPSPGPLNGTGPTAGSAQGPGPTAGSTNPADSLMVTNQSGGSCTSFCEAFYGGSCKDELIGGDITSDEFIRECEAACECLRRASPDCIDWLAGVFSGCVERGSCVVTGECLYSLEGTLVPPSSCASLQSAVENCGGEPIDF